MYICIYIYICIYYIYICIYIYIREREIERERECSQGSSCDVLPGGSLAKNITVTSANSSRSTNLICASDLFLFHIGSRPAVNMSPWSMCDWAWKLRALDSQLQGSNSLIKTGIVFFAAWTLWQICLIWCVYGMWVCLQRCPRIHCKSKSRETEAKKHKSNILKKG